jgi:hypothetical protein
VKAVDEAIYQVLADGGPWQAEQVHFGSPPTNTPPPYLIYGLSDSRRGQLAGFDTDHREFEYTFIAVSYDPDEAEAWRQAVEDILQYRDLIVPDWQPTDPFLWNGEAPYAGRKERDGRLLYTPGTRLTCGIQRERTNR